MSPALQITLLWFLFAATHVVPASVRLRPALIAKFGLRAYLGLYSLVSLAVFIPLVTVYVRNRHAGALFWDLRSAPGVFEISWIVSGLSFTFIVASLFQPSPLGMGTSGKAQPYGLSRITRHPMFVPLATLGAGHLLLQGYQTDVAFFGGLLVFGYLGCAHQDARKRALESERFGEFLDQTSLVPFAAMLAGRTRLVASELPWYGLAIGAAAAVGAFMLHTPLFLS